MSHKPAGLRTQALVNMGTTLFILGGVSFGSEVTRLAANVLTGLGFLGAGVIWQQKGNVRGLTTAALIWVNGSLGVVIALRMYMLAGLATILTLFALRFLSLIENLIKSKCKILHYNVTSRENKNVVDTIHEAMERCHFQEEPLAFEKSENGIKMKFAFCNTPLLHREFVNKLRTIDDVLEVKIE